MSTRTSKGSAYEPTAGGESRVVGRIAGMDGLRACAALLVLTYHAARFTNATLGATAGLLLAELKAGVGVFFVISGCVLYLPFARAIATSAPRPDWRRYAARRAVRILPAYWAALTVLTLAGQMNGAHLGDAWRFVGLVQSYHFSTLGEGLPVAWSLDVEVTFYLALPFLAGIAAWIASQSTRSRFASQLVLIGSLAAGSLLLRLLVTGSLTGPVKREQVLLMTALPGMIDWFALGMGLAVLRAAIELDAYVPHWLLALARRPGLCWLIAAVLYLAGVPAQGQDFFLATYGFATHLAIGLAAVFLVLPVLAPGSRAAGGAVMSFLRSRLLTWLGTVSYGIYLWHVSLLKLIDTAVGSPKGALAFLALLVPTAVGAVCLAAASWYLVERPAHRLYALGSLRVPVALRRLAQRPVPGEPIRARR